MNLLEIVTGDIKYNELSEILNNKTLNHIDLLREDLLQVEYPQNLLLDIGWYPSFHADGEFKLYVVKNLEWDNPLLTLNTKTISDLSIQIEAAQNLINKLISDDIPQLTRSQ